MKTDQIYLFFLRLGLHGRLAGRVCRGNPPSRPADFCQNPRGCPEGPSRFLSKTKLIACQRWHTASTYHKSTHNTFIWLILERCRCRDLGHGHIGIWSGATSWHLVSRARRNVWCGWCVCVCVCVCECVSVFVVVCICVVRILPE